MAPAPRRGGDRCHTPPRTWNAAPRGTQAALCVCPKQPTSAQPEASRGMGLRLPMIRPDCTIPHKVAATEQRPLPCQGSALPLALGSGITESGWENRTPGPRDYSDPGSIPGVLSPATSACEGVPAGEVDLHHRRGDVVLHLDDIGLRVTPPHGLRGEQAVARAGDVRVDLPPGSPSTGQAAGGGGENTTGKRAYSRLGCSWTISMCGEQPRQ
jgi:hypothetical protein